MHSEGYHVYHVYIITNSTKSVLYIGVTNYLAKRISRHSDNITQKKKTFAAKYKCKHLLYYEKFTWIHEAIAREKEIKGWRRQKKIDLETVLKYVNYFIMPLFVRYFVKILNRSYGYA